MKNGVCRWGRLAILAAAAAAALAAPAVAQDEQGEDAFVEDAFEAPPSLPDIEVIGVTPLSGAGTPIDRIPYNVQATGPGEFETGGQQTVYDFFNRNFAGASSADVQNNPYQQNFTYRGFVAGPLLGESVGIAAFVNGARVNDPFGDVVQSDLFPEMAIRRIELGNADPAFGFNALGGAMVMQTHNGTTFQGGEVGQSVGSFGRLRTTARAGAESGPWSAFAAWQRDREDGWRDASPSELDRLFADAGYEGDRGSARLDLSFADTDLIGNGLSPVELNEIDYEANFTTPDRTQNRNVMLSARGDYALGGGISIQGNVYWRRLRRDTLNGDEVDAEDCDDVDQYVCRDDDDESEEADNDEDAEEGGAALVIVDTDRNPIASFDLENEVYGALNTSATRTAAYGASLQTTIDRPVAGFDNRLIVGAGVDIGSTDFNSESEIGQLLRSRAVAGGPNRHRVGGILVVPGEVVPGADADDGDGFCDDSLVIDGESFCEDAAGPVALTADNGYFRGFVSNTMNAGDDLTLTGSLAANYATVELTDKSLFLGQPLDDLDGDHDFFSLNPAIGAAWNLASSGFPATLYGGFRQGSRAPSPAELTCADPEDPCNLPNAFVADPPLEQVVSRTFDAGLRGRVGRDRTGGLTSLDWNVGAFRAVNRDDIIFVSAGVGLSSGYFRNIPETRRQGVELSLSGAGARFDWFVNYSYLEATFQSAFRVTAENHPRAEKNEIPVEAGDFIPGIPRHSLGMGIDVEPLDGLRLSPSLVLPLRRYICAATRATC